MCKKPRLEQVEGLFVRKKPYERGRRNTRDRKGVVLGLGFKFIGLKKLSTPYEGKSQFKHSLGRED